MPVGLIASSAIGAGASIYGSKKAADAQRAGALRAIDAAKMMFNKAEGYLEPYTTTGKSALTSLAQLYGLTLPDGTAGGEPFAENSLDAFRRSPDYAFARDEGIGALTRSAAARGLLHSGNYLRDLTTFGQGLATQNFGNYAGRLMSLAQIGQSSAGQLAGNATSQGNTLAGLNLSVGNANAGGIVGATNAFTGGLGSLTNNLALYNFLNRGGGAYSGAMPLSLGNHGGSLGLLGFG
jgi:hypothetical protein